MTSDSMTSALLLKHICNQVWLKTLEGATITIHHVTTTTTIRDIKAMIQALKGFPIEHQLIVRAAIPFKDDIKLGELYSEKLDGWHLLIREPKSAAGVDSVSPTAVAPASPADAAATEAKTK